jgi:S-adenosylmethionine-dependent methyltransferase
VRGWLADATTLPEGAPVPDATAPDASSPGSTRPQTPPNRRGSIVLDLLTAALPAIGPAPLRIVDAGGGTGGIAVPLAALGHEVLVVDPSPDAMVSLRRRAEERADGSAARIRAVQGDLTDLPDHVPPGGADVVVCHDVLGVVDDPDAALRAVHDALRPGGLVSVLVVGRGGAVLARALAGRFGAAADLLAGDSATGRYDARSLPAALAVASLEVFAVHAVRVFADLVSGALLESDPGAPAALDALERAVATNPDYLPVAARLHAFARRPA